MKPLRAFLFSCTKSGDWTSAAFRELEPLLEAVGTTLAAENAFAAIHIGFWRPETAKIALLAQNWPGRLLLSETAIGSLPPPVRVSHGSIGEVDGLSFRVALDGFGYQLDDPKPDVKEKSLPIQPSLFKGTFTPRGWVEQLIINNPETELMLRDAGIWDEDSYHENEPTLETEDRIKLALYRFRMVTGTNVSKTNILDNLYACPNWFLSDGLRFLSLSVRTGNVFAANDLNAIGDLAVKGYSGLLKLPNMGKGSVHDLGALLWDSFIHGDTLKRTAVQSQSAPIYRQHNARLSNFVQFKPPPAKTAITANVEVLDNIIDGFVDAGKLLTDQEWNAWVDRIGFRRNQKNLQVLSEQIGITRERVRQIEVKIYRKLGTHPFWEELQNRLNGLLQGRDSPLLLNGIPALDPWFNGVEELKQPLREVFKHLLKNKFFVIDLGETPIVTRLSPLQWEKAISSAQALLNVMAKASVGETFVRVQIEALLAKEGEELRSELWSIVRGFGMWVTKPDGLSTLVGYGRSAESVVAAVLESAGQPLHFREIYRRSKMISDKQYDERRLHNVAQTIGVLYSRGTYGLFSHCPLTPKELALIEAEVEDIAAGAEPTKQWHSSELLDELLERGFDFDGKLTQYIINIALRSSKTFSNMRRMVWGYKETWQASAASRLDMRQAVLAVIEEGGRPLSSVEIRERLKGDRGLNSHFQIHPHGNLIRIGVGLWGLADRDVSVSDPIALLEKLANHLQTSQEGVHSSEVAALLGDIDESDAQAILGLLNRVGMRRDRAQYIYLAQWEDSRRIWPVDAVEQILNAHPNGVPIEAIRLEVNRLTKRVMNPTYVSHLLIHTEGAIYDPEKEVWLRQICTEDFAVEVDEDGVRTQIAFPLSN